MKIRNMSNKKGITILPAIIGVIVIGAIAVVLLDQKPEPIISVMRDNSKVIQDTKSERGESEATTNEDKDTQQEPEVITSEIDNSDWQTYRNEELAFSFEYPEQWRIVKNDSKIDVYSENYKMGLSLSIRKTEKSLEQFINDYNKSDQTSRILDQRKIIFDDNIEAVELTASTGIGIEDTFIFIVHDNNRYLIRYNRFDEIHSRIISSLHFID